MDIDILTPLAYCPCMDTFYNPNNNNIESMNQLERSGYGVFRGEKVETSKGVNTLWCEVWTGLAFFACIVSMLALAVIAQKILGA